MGIIPLGVHMGRKLQVLTDRDFGWWTVIGVPVRQGKKTLYLCRCQCGTTREVQADSLKGGKSTSCGCLQSQTFGLRVSLLAAERRLANGDGYKAPSRTRTYKSWIAMSQRCYHPNSPSFPSYGGRGIAVCDRWRLSYHHFLADMGERPNGHSLDRIDNDRGYEPDNCRWATATVQARNQRRSSKITHDGQTLTFAGWADETGFSPRLIRQRIRTGWPVALALTAPLGSERSHKKAAK